MIKFTLPLPPTNNVYYRRGKTRSGQSVTYLSEAGKQYKATVGKYCLINKANKPKLDDFKLSLVIHPKLTKKNVASLVIGDIDAYFKGVLDALQGFVYYDDGQVKKISAEYGEPLNGGAVTVIIEEYLS